VDASHDYTSVRRTIESLMPLVTPGGLLCGNDFLTATQDRKDLSGGVERAVRELLPGFEESCNLWGGVDLKLTLLPVFWTAHCWKVPV